MAQKKHELEEAKNKLAQNQHELEEAKNKLAQNQHELEEAKNKLAQKQHELDEKELPGVECFLAEEALSEELVEETQSGSPRSN